MSGDGRRDVGPLMEVHGIRLKWSYPTLPKWRSWVNANNNRNVNKNDSFTSSNAAFVVPAVHRGSFQAQYPLESSLATPCASTGGFTHQRHWHSPISLLESIHCRAHYHLPGRMPQGPSIQSTWDWSRASTETSTCGHPRRCLYRRPPREHGRL
jgi:hypothetical protein